MIHIKSTYKISENAIGKDFVKIPLLAHAGEYPPCLVTYRKPRYPSVRGNASISKSCIGGYIRLAIPIAI